MQGTDVRSIDPVRCWARHVRRGTGGDPSAKQLGLVYFVRDDVVRGEDGLNGRHGWQTAAAELAVSDDGRFTLTLPQATGRDGVEHAARFAILTDDAYEPGEEWIELWSDLHQTVPLFVGTPTDYQTTPAQITITGQDLTEVLAGALSSEVDAWDAHAPADVLAHYSRIDAVAYALTNYSLGASTPLLPAIAGVQDDCWTMQLRAALQGAQAAGQLLAQVGGFIIRVYLRDDAAPTTEPVITAETIAGAMPAMFLSEQRPGMDTRNVDLKVIALYERVLVIANGEVVFDFRRPYPFADFDDPFPTYDPGHPLRVACANAMLIDSLSVSTRVPFAARGASSRIQRRLPGVPPATGLRGRYWSASANWARSATSTTRIARMFPLIGVDSEPVVDRLEPTIDFSNSSANYPPGIPAPSGVVAPSAHRFSGAIYLDLEAADRKVRLSPADGACRLYIGRTMRHEPAADDWWSGGGAGAYTSPALRSWIGEAKAGWYPIVIEQYRADGDPRQLRLQDTALDGAGSPVAWATVPTTRLSPIGCFEDIVRNTPHRSILGDVADGFGYQWRIEPRSLESGEFPGQLVALSQVGRATNVTIDDEDLGGEPQVQGAARDVVDALTVDAAGIADPKGSGQLSVQVADYPRAAAHLALRQGYESLADITETPMLYSRASSMLVLRSSPNEQVGVRPKGQRDLADTFPLTGQLALMAWTPGDGVLLDLASVRVKDTLPRQLMTVGWPDMVPDDLGSPAVGFRQRPRNPRLALQKLRGAILGSRRTGQGSIALLTGSPGGATSAGGAVAGHPDSYTRCPLPANLDDVDRATLHVRSISGTGWRMEISGVDLGATDGGVPRIGPYDVTRAVRALATGRPEMRARLIGGASGSYEITLEIRVRVD